MHHFKNEYCDEMIRYFRERNPFQLGPDMKRRWRGGSLPPGQIAFPTFAGFAESIGVTSEDLHRWATSVDSGGEPIYAEFADCYMRAKDIQAVALINGGLTGLYDSEFAIFACKNILGWFEDGGCSEFRPRPPRTASAGVEDLPQPIPRTLQ